MFRNLLATNTRQTMIISSLKDVLRPFIRRFCNFHRYRGRNDIVILAAPRSGSTWLMEIIAAQPGMKYIDEPLTKSTLDSLNMLPIKTRWVYSSLSSDEENILAEYFKGNNKLENFAPHNIFRNNYHFFTDRRVIKIIRATALICWFVNNLQLDTIYMIRHPIAQSLSCIRRGHDSRLDHYIDDEMFVLKHLSRDTETFVRRIMTLGSQLDQIITEWCLHNLVPLRLIRDQTYKRIFNVITYEQLVTDPDSVLIFLFEALHLKSRKALFKSVAIPSRTTDSSTEKKRHGIVERNTDFLVSSWRGECTDAQERQAFEILERFGIDAYSYGNLMPNNMLFVSNSFRASHNNSNRPVSTRRQ